MVDVTPPLQVKLPDKFRNDPELAVYFDQLNRMLLQLWERTGGHRDYVEDNPTAHANQMTLSAIQADLSDVKTEVEGILASNTPVSLEHIYRRLDTLEADEFPLQRLLQEVGGEIVACSVYNNGSSSTINSSSKVFCSFDRIIHTDGDAFDTLSSTGVGVVDAGLYLISYEYTIQVNSLGGTPTIIEPILEINGTSITGTSSRVTTDTFPYMYTGSNTSVHLLSAADIVKLAATRISGTDSAIFSANQCNLTLVKLR